MSQVSGLLFMHVQYVIVIVLIHRTLSPELALSMLKLVQELPVLSAPPDCRSQLPTMTTVFMYSMLK